MQIDTPSAPYLSQVISQVISPVTAREARLSPREITHHKQSQKSVHRVEWGLIFL